MKRNSFLTTGSVLLGAWMITGTVWAQTSGTTHPDVSGPGASKGGSRSEQSGESGMPLPKGSRQSGTVDMGKSSGGTTGMSAKDHQSDSSGAGAMHHGSSDAKEVQQALKDKGFDPGPLDGVIGSRTKEAIKSFQTASNLRATGTLDSETREKLGVQSDASTTSSRSSSGKMKTSTSVKSGDTTVGKDTDQPNQTPKKIR
jgi:hypothetical protein